MSAITPDKLRAAALTGAPFAAVSSTDCDLLADAMEIADSCARSHIECTCMHAGGTPTTGLFWDTSQVAPEDRPWIDQELRYLDRRGLLIREPGEPHIVSFKDPE